MQTKQSVTNLDNHQPSTACGEKHAAMKLPIRSTVIAAFGLLSVLLSVHLAADAQGIPPRSEPAHARHLTPTRFDLVPASDPIAACLPNAAAEVAVFPREDVRGVDTLDLHAEGLRPNTTFAVFLTEMPVPPFGAVQYIGDFTTNAAGRGSVRVDAIIDEAFAFNNITGVRTELNHIVFWFADPNDDEDCVPGSAPTPLRWKTMKPESRRCLRRTFSLARRSRNSAAPFLTNAWSGMRLNRRSLTRVARQSLKTKTTN